MMTKRLLVLVALPSSKLLVLVLAHFLSSFLDYAPHSHLALFREDYICITSGAPCQRHERELQQKTILTFARSIERLCGLKSLMHPGFSNRAHRRAAVSVDLRHVSSETLKRDYFVALYA